LFAPLFSLFKFHLFDLIVMHVDFCDLICIYRVYTKILKTLKFTLMSTERQGRIILSMTRTGLNRLVSKSAKIRSKRRQFKDTADPLGEILVYLTNYRLKNKEDKGIKTTFGAEWPAVYAFWTQERIDLFIHESRQFYNYRRFTYADREDVPAVLPFSPAMAEVLIWFDEVKEAKDLK
jgi:hypothetical protein